VKWVLKKLECRTPPPPLSGPQDFFSPLEFNFLSLRCGISSIVAIGHFFFFSFANKPLDGIGITLGVGCSFSFFLVAPFHIFMNRVSGSRREGSLLLMACPIWFSASLTIRLKVRVAIFSFPRSMTLAFPGGRITLQAIEYMVWERSVFLISCPLGCWPGWRFSPVPESLLFQSFSSAVFYKPSSDLNSLGGIPHGSLWCHSSFSLLPDFPSNHRTRFFFIPRAAWPDLAARKSLRCDNFPQLPTPLLPSSTPCSREVVPSRSFPSGSQVGLWGLFVPRASTRWAFPFVTVPGSLVEFAIFR